MNNYIIIVLLIINTILFSKYYFLQQHMKRIQETEELNMKLFSELDDYIKRKWKLEDEYQIILSGHEERLNKLEKQPTEVN